MICIEIPLVLFGLYLLVSGNLSIRGRTLSPKNVRMAGMAMIGPIGLAYCIAFSIGLSVGMSGKSTISSGDQTNIMVIEIIALAASLILGIILLSTAPSAPPTPYYPGMGGYYPPGYPPQPGYPQQPGYPPQPYYQQPTVPYPGQMAYGQLNTPPLPVLFSLHEAAQYLNFKTDDEVLQLIQMGQLPANQSNGEYRISKEALDRYMEQGR
jgi:excisionase family DNA binding protein